jgi:alkanesulfonate monooxygenase SsuD/methylene tetrahydromethanopterin reductase-like flavin-dependent oxidoreductase (luciferase family)
VRALWRDTPATFEGRFTRFEGVSIDPKPVQKPGPPIWVGGRSDAALRRAAVLADGWVSYVVHAARFADSLRKIRSMAAEAGRSLDTFTPAHLVFITVGRDYEAAKATWVRLLSKRYAQDFSPLAERYGIIGTPEQCVDQLGRFVDAGCRYFLMNPIVDREEQQEQLEVIVDAILPRFRAA